MNDIYLDYAATTPLSPKVKKAMDPYWSDIFGNPMSMHLFGQKAAEGVEQSRQISSDYFSVQPEEIIFTSGATESNNLVVKGIVGAISLYNKRYIGRVNSPENFTPHIVTSSYEHHCLLNSVKKIVARGLAEATFIEPNRDGIIDPEKVISAIKDNTVLVSIMYVNNEIGTVNDLKTIGEALNNIKIKRKEKAGLIDKEALPIYFHSDLTQGVNFLDCNAKKLNLDLFSMSGHKIYGPKGVGLLGVKKGVIIEKIQQGGDQEFNLRSGTHNVTGIVGLGKALEEVSRNKKIQTKKVASLQKHMAKKLKKRIKNIQINGSMKRRIVNNLNISFNDVEGESMLLLLSAAGIACSTGSACSSESLEPSHVLLSIGCSHPEAHSSLRFSLSHLTKKEDLDRTVEVLAESVEKLRNITGEIKRKL